MNPSTSTRTMRRKKNMKIPMCIMLLLLVSPLPTVNSLGPLALFIAPLAAQVTYQLGMPLINSE